MQVTKTIKVPLHYGNTGSKFRKLDKLTARMTYCVWQWSDIIAQERRLSRKALSPHEKEVQEKTNLSAGFVQQCKDKAIWCWKSYKEQHKMWRRMLRQAEKRKHTKKGERWHDKLLKREPQEPFSSARSRLKKSPARIDSRTGVVELADIKLTDYVVRVSTLFKQHPMTLLLNPSNYHKEQLEKGSIRDFEIVKRNNRYYCHITTTYDVPTQPIHQVQGVDLGIVRPIATVSLSPTPCNFRLVKDKTKHDHLRKLNDRVSHLRRLEKWNVLRELRNKRQNASIDHDRKLTKSFVENHCHNSLVVVGNPEYIRYNHYRGNGDKAGRKMLNNWAFGRIGDNIIHYCTQQGTIAVKENEWWTSSKCCRCGGKVESDGRRITCTKCGVQYDREFNSTVNIALKGMPLLGDKPFLEKAGGKVDMPRIADESPQTGGVRNLNQLPTEALPVHG